MTIRQYKMFNFIAHNQGVSVKQAEELNQNIFGSLCYRRWLEWDTRKEKFIPSRNGIEHRSEINEWELDRKVNNHQLSIRVRPILRRSIKRIA